MSGARNSGPSGLRRQGVQHLGQFGNAVWSLIYCEGPEGKQLEVVQALGPVKQTFDRAPAARRRMVVATE